MTVKEVIINFRTNIQAMTNAITMNNAQFKKSLVATGQLRNKYAELGTKIRLMTRGMRDFRMEMLGVLFFGQAIKNMFANMLRPGLEMFGVFDMWTTTLQVLFLPVLQQIVPLLYDMMAWLMELPEPAQKAIGYFALFGWGIGNILEKVGMLTLGLGSLFQTNFLTNLSKFVTALATLVTDPKKGLAALEKSGFARGLSLALGVYVTYEFVKTVSEMMTDVHTALYTRLKSVFLGVLGGGLIGFAVLGGPGIWIGMTIGLGIALVLNLTDIAFETGFFNKIIDYIQKSPIGGVIDVAKALPGIYKTYKAAKSGYTGAVFTGEQPQSVLPSYGAGKNVWSGDLGQSFSKGGAVINQTNNINIADKSMIERALKDNNASLLSDVKRMVKA